MTWRKELGDKIRAERIAKGLSQEELAAKTSVSRAQISNIEKGKSKPAVNIVTDIADALGASFVIGGCRISRVLPGTVSSHKPPPAQQLCFTFDTDYRFSAGSLRINSAETDVLLLSLRLAKRKVA